MEIIGGKYVRKTDFHNSSYFKKINNHIDACLLLIERLIKLNKDSLKIVAETLKVPDYIIDFRIEQFRYYHEALAGIYYGCYSLKNVYETSTIMNFKGIDTTIGIALITQERYISFMGIVNMSSIFEFTRNNYEKNIKGKPYYEKMKGKYRGLGESQELLNNFRNTIHSNGIWEREKPLTYSIRAGRIEIKNGEVIVYDYWKLYRIVKDCIELSKLMALDNKANLIRDTRLSQGKEKIVVFDGGEELRKFFENYKAPE